jgi:DNA topoisomerase IA
MSQEIRGILKLMKGSVVANVDFTLEDIARQTERITEGIVERAFVKERENTRAMIEASAARVTESVTKVVTEVITTEFMSFWDNNLSPVLEDMQTEIGEVKVRLGHVETRLGAVENEIREVKRDLRMELRARKA